MKKTLIITEKPSVAHDIAKVLRGFSNKKDYLESEQFVLTWALGHLVTLFEPEDYDKKLKFWQLATLPIVPDEFQFKPIEKTKSRLSLIKKLMKRSDIDVIVNACDAGREGELIFRNIFRIISPGKKTVKRLWLSAMTEEEISKGFAHLQNSEEFDSLGTAALLRMESDWLAGINATRAFTRRWGSGEILSLGRVQTPTLSIICSREQVIKNFKKEQYFELEGIFAAKNISYEGTRIDKKGNTRIKTKKEASTLLEKVKGKEGNVLNIKRSEKKKPHPLLYDLTELQRDANRRFGYSAQRTLNIAQRLYESKKLITYPRTDSRYLPKSMVSEAEKIIKGIFVHPYDKFIEEILSKQIKLDSRVVNDKGVTDHFAIIPTGKMPVFSQLKGEEQNIFDLVARRFLSVFFSYAVVEGLSFKTVVEKEVFKTELSRIKEPGWMVVYNVQEKNILVNVEETMKVLLDKINLLEKETQPPARYNDATILTAMETAGKLVEDEELKEAMKERGLGTPATRASIIERLISVGYIERFAKSLVPLDKGMRLIDLVMTISAGEILDPALTGEWEKKLRDIEKRKLQPDEFMNGIKQLTSVIVKKVKDYKGDSTVVIGDGKPIGKCPKCGAGVVETAKAFSCTSRAEKTCDFIIWKKLVNKTITKEIAEKLLKGETIHMTGFISKARKRFDADIALVDSKVSFLFPERQKDELLNPTPIGKCPKCGADILEGKETYFCSKRDEGCTFYIKKVLGNKRITKNIVVNLLNNKTTELLTDFLSKNGKPFSAFLYFDNNYKVRFKFENKNRPRSNRKRQ